MKLGQKYKSKNGLIGKIEETEKGDRLVIRDNTGKVTQTISLRKIDLTKFEKIDDNSQTSS